MVDERRNDIRDRDEGAMKIHLPGVIKTLGEAMYSDPWVALRELIQNASDSCTVRRRPIDDPETGQRRPFDPTAEPAVIRVYYDPFQATLVVEDNGAGMTREEVQKFLSVIGSSNTDEVRDMLEAMGESSWADRLIGRFGLGLLSAFIIGQSVQFETRSYLPDSKTVWWMCDGGQQYQIGHLDRGRPVGTRVTVHVDGAHRDMLRDEDVVIQRICRYADLLEIPILYGPENAARQVTSTSAPWLTDPPGTSQEYREYLQHRFADDSILHVIPIEIYEPPTQDAPALRVGGALFVPRRPGGPLDNLGKEYGNVAVYVRRMFVADEDPHLLPRWAKFLKGVVDSPVLRETTSRESILKDAAFHRVQQALARLILDDLTNLSTSDPRLFREIATQHGVVIKIMAIAEPELFAAFRDIVLFRVDNRPISLATYFRETGTDNQPRRTVYYSSNQYGVGQHGYLFAQKGWRVIDASSYPDEPFLLKYAESYPDEIELVSLDTDSGDIFIDLNPKDDAWLDLEAAFLRNGIEACVVEYDPPDIPAVLVDTKEENVSDDQLDQILKSDVLSDEMKQVFRTVKATRDRRRRTFLGRGAILQLNARSDIIQRLAERQFDAETADVMIVVYNNALMLSARALTQDQAKKIFDGNNRTIRQLMDRIDEVQRLRQHPARAAEADGLMKMLDDLRDEARALKEERTAIAARCDRALERSRQAEEDRDRLSVALEDASQEQERLRSNLAEARARDEPRSQHVTCFFALPFARHDQLVEGLRMVLETDPYFFQVVYAKDETAKDRISDSVKALIADAHCYAFEITDENPNVMMELGYAYWQYPNRPIFLLQKEGEVLKDLADLGDMIIHFYPWAEDTPAEALRAGLSSILDGFVPFKRLRAAHHKRYLSVYSMPTFSQHVRAAICRRFTTVEDLVAAVEADDAAVVRSLNVHHLEPEELRVQCEKLRRKGI